MNANNKVQSICTIVGTLLLSLIDAASFPSTFRQTYSIVSGYRQNASLVRGAADIPNSCSHAVHLGMERRKEVSVTELSSQFLEACEECDYVRAKALVRKGASPSARDSEMKNGLMLECGVRPFSRQLARFLLSRGVHIEARDDTGRTALMLGAGTDHPDAVKFLLDNGACVNKSDANHITALMLACCSDVETGENGTVGFRNPQCVLLLLRHGAKVNVQDRDGNTALHYACKSDAYDRFTDEQLPIIGTLIHFGAKVNSLNHTAETPLFTLVRTYSGTYPKHTMRISEYLLRHGAHCRSRNAHGLSIVDIAREKGCPLALIRMLQAAN